LLNWEPVNLVNRTVNIPTFLYIESEAEEFA